MQHLQERLREPGLYIWTGLCGHTDDELSVHKQELNITLHKAVPEEKMPLRWVSSPQQYTAAWPQVT